MTSAFTARFNVYFADCWVCGRPTMKVEECADIDMVDEYRVIEQCHSEHCDHYDTYYIKLED